MFLQQVETSRGFPHECSSCTRFFMRPASQEPPEQVKAARAVSCCRSEKVLKNRTEPLRHSAPTGTGPAAPSPQRDGGGRASNTEPNRTEPDRTAQLVHEPKAVHAVLSHRHPEPDGGGVPPVRRDGARPAGGLPAGWDPDPEPEPPVPPPPSSSPVRSLLFLSSGPRARLPRFPRGAAVLRGRGGLRRRGAAPGAGAGRRARRLVRRPGAPLPEQ